MLNVAVIGYGYWGPNLVRNFSESDQTQVRAVADQDAHRLALLRKRHPAVDITTDYRRLLERDDIDAVAIATPVAAHFPLALEALRADKHVFVEKPLTETSDQAMQLIAEASKRGLLLHVDHTFIYTGAVRKMRELVKGGELGDVFYYDSVRVNLGLFQQDVDVVWDLAVHDLSIMDYVFSSKPTAISASGMRHFAGNSTNIAYLTVFFEDDFIAHLHVNWLAPVKIRRTLVGGSRKMIVYDDLEPSEKIKIYDKGITVENTREDIYKQRIGYRTGDMCAPKLDSVEALQVEVSHFARCITAGESSLSDGHAGLRVVQMLEAASHSLGERGRPVKLGWKGRGV
jgi:predicted dehydrogenase